MKRDGTLVRIGFAVIGAVVGLLLCELALRLYLNSTQGFGTLEQFQAYERGERIETRSQHPLVLITRLSTNRRLIYELRANLEKTFGGKIVRTNSAGMRDDLEYEIERPPATLRIVGIGDSGMWGWNVHQGEDFLTVLRESLAKREGPIRYEVLNLAVPGYSTMQEVEMLRARGLAYSPSIVLLGWCENDFTPPLFMLRQKDHLRSGGGFYVLNAIFRPERYRQKVEPTVIKLGDIDRSLVDSSIIEGSGPEGVRHWLGELKRMSEEHGFRLLSIGALHERSTGIHRDVGIEALNVREEASFQRLPPEAGIFGCHPRVLGHRHLAARIEEILDEKGWLSPSMLEEPRGDSSRVVSAREPK